MLEGVCLKPDRNPDATAIPTMASNFLADRSTMTRATDRPRRLLLAAGGAALASLGLGLGAPGVRAESCPALLNHRFKRLQDETPLSLCQFSGKVLLVVNTASRCGYTKQYEGLEALHRKYGGRGLVVMGFPSNDFRQEAPTREEIAAVCFDTFGVQFPMFVESPVKGANANPLHAALAQATGEAPGWNFHKYLVDRQARPIGSYRSAVTPDDPKLLAAIEAALSAR